MHCRVCCYSLQRHIWQALPRTRWVSCDERLPTAGLFFLALAGKHAIQCHAYQSEDGEWFDETERPVSDVTHWLDGLPTTESLP